MINKGAINNNLTRGNKKEIVSWGEPDYTAGISITISATETTITHDGFLMGGWSTAGGNTTWTIYVNNVEVASAISRGGSSSASAVFFPVKKGDLVKATTNQATGSNTILYPYKM